MLYACKNTYLVNQALITLANLQRRGITEDRLFQMNYLIEQNGYKPSGYANTE